MGQGPRYRVILRRRRQNRTDYRMRKTMIASRKLRLIIRGSLAHMCLQVSEAHLIGDKMLASANSKSLASFGWKAPTGNIPAAYLTGYLLGKKALTVGVKETILDIGLVNITKGSRIFAALKGATDAGLSVPHGDRILPSSGRLKGEHIASYAKSLQDTDPVAYDKIFSKYRSIDLGPEELPKNFAQIKEKIDEAFKEGK